MHCLVSEFNDGVRWSLTIWTVHDGSRLLMVDLSIVLYYVKQFFTGKICHCRELIKMNVIVLSRVRWVTSQSSDFQPWTLTSVMNCQKEVELWSAAVSRPWLEVDGGSAMTVTRLQSICMMTKFEQRQCVCTGPQAQWRAGLNLHWWWVAWELFGPRTSQILDTDGDVPCHKSAGYYRWPKFPWGLQTPG